MASSTKNTGGALGMKELSGVDSELLVKRLVEKGLISAEVVNAEVDEIRAGTSERIKQTSKTVSKKQISPEQQQSLLAILKYRFESNMNRHIGMDWSKIQQKLEADPKKLWSLNKMEISGGEPDVVGYDKKKDEYIFVDSFVEPPEARTRIAYDKEAEEWLKSHGNNECNGNAIGMAKKMGVKIPTGMQYRHLQELGVFDLHSRCWLKTSVDIRDSGSALVGCRHKEKVHVFRATARDCHWTNVFRGLLRV